MRSNRSTLVLAFLFYFSSGLLVRGESPVERSNQAEILRETVIRHFRASYKLEEQSLICRTQVKALHSYLRKTQSPYLPYFTGVLRRVPSDKSRLAVIYFRNNGAQVLDKVAAESGGFGPIAQLCTRSEGVLLIKEAIKKGEVETLREAIARQIKDRTGPAVAKKSDQNNIPARIYTVSELIDTVLLLADSSNSRHSPERADAASPAKN